MTVAVVEKTDNKAIGVMILLTGTMAEVLGELNDTAVTTAAYKYDQQCRNYKLFFNGTNISAYYETAG